MICGKITAGGEVIVEGQVRVKLNDNFVITEDDARNFSFRGPASFEPEISFIDLSEYEANKAFGVFKGMLDVGEVREIIAEVADVSVSGPMRCNMVSIGDNGEGGYMVDVGLCSAGQYDVKLPSLIA